MWLFCIFYVFGLQIYRVWVRVSATVDKKAAKLIGIVSFLAARVMNFFTRVQYLS